MNIRKLFIAGIAADGEKSCVLTEIMENVYTFTMPAADVTVTAVFTEVTYTANLVVVGKATTALNGYDSINVPANYLDTVTVTITPDAGWQLVSIVINDGAVKVNEEVKPEGRRRTATIRITSKSSRRPTKTASLVSSMSHSWMSTRK